MIIEGQPGTETNPLRAKGTVEEIAQRVKAGKWSTIDLDALANAALGQIEMLKRMKAAIEVYPWELRRPQLDAFLKMINEALDNGSQQR